MKPSGQRIKEQMVDSAERALEKTAEDVLRRAQRDAPTDTGELVGSGKAETVRVGDALVSKVSFTAAHAASQEIGGRHKVKGKGGPGGFIKFHPHGGKPNYLGDALKSGVRRYRENLKRDIRQGLQTK
jgi:Bacteriophage HK97-gp10, putative tail-component